MISAKVCSFMNLSDGTGRNEALRKFSVFINFVSKLLITVYKKVTVTNRNYFSAKNAITSPNFVKRHNFRIVSGNCPKLCEHCAFPQNFHTRKLGEITAFYIVFIIQWVSLITSFIRKISSRFDGSVKTQFVG